MILIRVLLPAPFSPRSACTSPGRASKSTSSSATTPGKSLRMPCISSTGRLGSAAGRAGPSQQHGADHLQLETKTSVVLAGVHTRDEDEGAQRGEHAGDDETERLH